MSSICPKKPIVARRNVKQKFFSTSVSCSRIKSLQDLLKEQNLDAILAIDGVDSRYNDGCRQLLNYLFFDFYKTRKNEIESTGQPEEVVEDIMLVIRPTCVDVYCNPINVNFILPYISCWPSLQLHCLSESKYDEDDAEEFKIVSLVRMIEGCHKVALPYYNSQDDKDDFDKMLIEKWPVIQAYGLDSMGQRGFFTMSHEVVDISRLLGKVYDKIDAVAMETLVTQDCQLFGRQMSSLISNMDFMVSSGCEGDELLRMNEGRIGEPLLTYYSHGRFLTSNRDYSKSARPFLLLGTHSDRKTLQSSQRVESIDHVTDDDHVTLRDAGLMNKPATHMVCQLVSPRGPLLCSRTYFLQSTFSLYPVKNNSPDPLSECERQDIRLLSDMYTTAVQSVYAAIKVFSETNNLEKTEAAVKTKIYNKWRELLGSENEKHHLPPSDNVLFTLTARGGHGRHVSVGESLMILVAAVTIYDIPSLLHDGHILGSVVFSESFSLSTIKLADEVDEVTYDKKYAVLTANVPKYVTWPICDMDTPILKQLSSLVENDSDGFSLGERLTNQRQPLKIVTSPDLEIGEVQQGYVCFHMYGMLLHTSHGETLVVPHTELKLCDYFTQDSDTVTLVRLHYKPSFITHLPDWLLAHSDSTLVLVIQPKTKTYKTFHNQVLPIWRRESSLRVHPVTDLQAELQSVYEYGQRHYRQSQELQTSPWDLACLQIQHLNKYLEHYCISSVTGEYTVPRSMCHSDRLPASDQSEAEKDDSDLIFIHVISGLPGSYKQELSRSITNAIKDENRWLVLEQPDDDTSTFQPIRLQQSLTTALAAQRRKRPGMGRKPLRLLVPTPGYTSSVDVIRAILYHPDAELLRNLRIGAVTVCVNPSNMYIENKVSFPLLLDQCIQGFVSNFVITESSNTTLLSEAQTLLRCVNPGAAQIVTDWSKTLRSGDVDHILSKSAFWSQEMIKLRYMNRPGWDQPNYPGPFFRPEMTSLCLRFTLPLSKTNLQNQLKVLRSGLKSHPYNGNVYEICGIIKLQDCVPMYKFTFSSLVGVYKTTPCEILPTPPSVDHQNQQKVHDPYFLTFTGVGLREDSLKDWTQGCAPKKPEKSPPRCRENLTKSEWKQIHAGIHRDTLPEGWFYNGAQFVSLEGGKTDFHPNLDMAVDEYLISVNSQIQEHNIEIDQTPYCDLFVE